MLYLSVARTTAGHGAARRAAISARAEGKDLEGSAAPARRARFGGPQRALRTAGRVACSTVADNRLRCALECIKRRCAMNSKSARKTQIELIALNCAENSAAS